VKLETKIDFDDALAIAKLVVFILGGVAWVYGLMIKDLYTLVVSMCIMMLTKSISLKLKK